MLLVQSINLTFEQCVYLSFTISKDFNDKKERGNSPKQNLLLLFDEPLMICHQCYKIYLEIEAA